MKTTALITGIDHIQIAAPRGSEARVRAFYGDVLGLREIPKPPQLLSRGGLWYECGPQQLHIGLDDAPFNEASRRHVAFQVADLNTMRKALQTHGHAIEEDTAPLEGRRRFYCRDTVGNRVEFVEVQALTPAVGVNPAASRQPEFEFIEEYLARNGRLERLALSADGRWLAVGTAVEAHDHQPPTVYVWRFGAPDDPEVEIEMSASVWEMAFAPDSQELACLSEDGSLETWRTSDFESAAFAELPQQSSGLAYAGDGEVLAVGARADVALFRPGLELLHTLHPISLGQISLLAADPHEAMLAIAGEALFIQLWQIKPLQKSAWELRGHATPAIQLSFNPAQPGLAAVTDDGTVFWWDLNGDPEAPQALNQVDRESSPVNAIAFSPDGRWLACGDESGEVCVWDWQARQVVTNLQLGHAPIQAVAFSADSQHLAAGDESGRVHMWRVI